MVSTREQDGAYYEFVTQEQSADYGAGGLAPWENRPDYDYGSSRGRPQSHPEDHYRHERPRYDDYPPTDRRSRPRSSNYPPPSRAYDYDDRRPPPPRRQHPSHHPDPYYEYEEDMRRRPHSSDRYDYDDERSHRSSRTEQHHRNRSHPHQQHVVVSSKSVAPSRPRSQDAYSEYQKQWEDQYSFSTDVARDAVESYTYSSSPAMYDYELQQEKPKIDYSLPEEDQQRQAFAEYERMKKEKDLKEQPPTNSAPREDPFSPSKMYRETKAMSKEELRQEMQCPCPIPKPPPPPYDLRLTHRPEFWEHIVPKVQHEPVKTKPEPLPEPEPNPVEEEPSQKEPQLASINAAFDEGSIHTVKFSWDAPYPFPIDSCHSERQPPAKKAISPSSTSNLKPAPIMATKVSYKSCSDDNISSGSKSSLDDRKMPFKVHGGNGVFHPMPTQPYASASAGKVGAFCEKPQVMIEIQPGYSLPLRGSEETMQAVQAGEVNATKCMACTTEMVVAEECTFVVCAVCRTVGGVGDAPFGDKEGCVGLGLLKEVYDASRY